MKPQDNIELKEKFEETLTNDGLFEDDLRGYRKMKTNNATIVWNFFLPHLKDNNKIRREAEECKLGPDCDCEDCKDYRRGERLG